MDCNEARMNLLDRRRGTSPADVRTALEAHLDGCDDCRHEDAADRELSNALEHRLPRLRAPASLRRSVEQAWDAGRVLPPRASRTATTWWPFASAAALALAVSGGLAWQAARAPRADVVAEAVNDHLRVLYAQRPLEIESGGIHQVKPWFEGRIDFAPVVPFAGDDDFPLQGGAVAYFIDRKAATFVFKRRLHLLTLFVFRADGLPWPTVARERVGSWPASLETSRGFHVLLWRSSDLGYALVSDVDERDVRALGARIAAEP
jgi:anti-sigma factor RsiW